MTREEKIERAKELRGEGLNFSEIARRLEVGRTTAFDYVTGRVTAWKKANPEKCRQYNLARNDRKREVERERAGDCSGCGAHLSDVRASQCPQCERATREKDAKERTERFIELRRAGLNNKAIAEREGCRFSVVANTLHRADRYGLEVPPSPYWNRKKVA